MALSSSRPPCPCHKFKVSTTANGLGENSDYDDLDTKCEERSRGQQRGGGRGSWRYRDLFDAGLYEAEEDDELCTTEEESSDDEFEIVFD